MRMRRGKAADPANVDSEVAKLAALHELELEKQISTKEEEQERKIPPRLHAIAMGTPQDDIVNAWREVKECIDAVEGNTFNAMYEDYSSSCSGSCSGSDRGGYDNNTSW